MSICFIVDFKLHLKPITNHYILGMEAIITTQVLSLSYCRTELEFKTWL